jgi:serine/threonine protein kinase
MERNDASVIQGTHSIPVTPVFGILPAVSPFAPGTTFGTYRLDHQLGEGGMGTVYRATDTKLNRAVAIKFVSTDLADASARRRFQREAQLASSLNHPHILTVYDTGEWDGRQYLVSELVDGGTLRDWIKASPLGLAAARARRWTRGSCRSMVDHRSCF